MIKISKAERDYLLTKGVRCGENGVASTIGKSKKKTYYLCESKRNKELINEYRSSIISKDNK